MDIEEMVFTYYAPEGDNSRESSDGTAVCSICGTVHDISELLWVDGEYVCSECLEENTVCCSDCGRRILKSNNSGSESTPLCRECFEDYYARCELCGEIVPADELVEVSNGDMICSRCASEETVICERCGARVYTDDAENSDNMTVCRSCFDNYYTRCENCDAIISYSEAYTAHGCDYCCDCYNSLFTNGGIRNYSYKPNPIFYGSGSRYFGVELEIDKGGEDDDNANDLMDIINADDKLIYCKHDGSLNNGFEIVTHPMTLDFHMHRMPWAKLANKAISMGYRSHQPGTCGLHVHVNRDSFGDTLDKREGNIARVLYIVEKYWGEMLRFSRRTEAQLNRWAARYGYKDSPNEFIDLVKNYGEGRYSSINLCNSNTIEFRIFRGTLKYNTIIATLQLVNHICDLAVTASNETIHSLTWSSFVLDYCTEPELIQYLKERGIYVNEPIESEEEI